MFMRNKETSNFVILNVQKTESKNNLKATKNIYKNLFQNVYWGITYTRHMTATKLKLNANAMQIVWSECVADY